MPDKITNYQCPACTGPLHFDPASGKLTCDYCGSVFAAAEIEAMYAEQNAAAAAAAEAAEAHAAQTAENADAPEGAWDIAGAGAEWGDDAGSIRVYNCPSCGAELLCEETTAATSCPYCGNPSILPGQLSGAKKPDYVIPFKLDKDAAVAALKRHYARKPFLPKRFSENNHIQEIQGLYVPFWLFDADADADITYHATRSHSHTRGDYEITTTEHFRVRRAGSAAFRRIPVDGSSKMPDDHMDSIEPFDYSQMQPFSMSYLPGYLADKYDVSASDCAARADDRCRSSIRDIMRSDVHGYAMIVPEHTDIRLTKGAVKYALLPVWVLNTRWRDKDYLFAMNGQTGKLVGDLPISRGKYFAAFAAIAAALFLLLNVLGVSRFIAEIIALFFE